MTYAPPCVKNARAYLLGRGLPANSVGIVGDPAHKATGGYHCGNDWLSDAGKLYSDYSKRESSRDRPGSDAAMALDIGGLSATELYRLSKFIVSACQRGEAWTRDIREVIYYDHLAGVVRRWDRLGIRSSGDSSHQWHTHLGYHRDSEGRDKTELFQRYYEPARFAVTESAPATNEEDEDMTKGVVLFHAAATVSGTLVPAEYVLCVPGLTPIRTPSEGLATVWVIQNHGPGGSSVSYGADVAAYEAQIARFALAV